MEEGRQLPLKNIEVRLTKKMSLTQNAVKKMTGEHGKTQSVIGGVP